MRPAVWRFAGYMILAILAAGAFVITDRLIYNSRIEPPPPPTNEIPR